MAPPRRALLSSNVLDRRQKVVEHSAWTEGLHWFSDLFSDDCVSSCTHRYDCDATDDDCVCNSSNLHSIHYCLDTECYKTDAPDFMSEVKEWCDDYYGNSRWLTSSIVYATSKTLPGSTHASASAASQTGSSSTAQITTASTASNSTAAAPSSQATASGQGALASAIDPLGLPAIDGDKDDGSGLALGSIVGICCGTIILIVLVLAACWLYRKYLKQVRVRQIAELARLQRRGDPKPMMTQTGAQTMTYPSGFDITVASTAASDSYFIKKSPRHKKFREPKLSALPESMIMPDEPPHSPRSAAPAYFSDATTSSNSVPYSPTSHSSLGLSYMGSFTSTQDTQRSSQNHVNGRQRLAVKSGTRIHMSRIFHHVSS
ncbi:hypothetical protein P389DRAFT_197419 [Cystobasidium minutum MCA 4210]|uniref:uncharacterized protein n=1 Tax=Cystobasidium minutum MCA 4210 TaxID=1397322 RepID=UPI0034CF4AED|eukprot:jgi/Rhomi1/197419/gm1.5633_g